jgi:hypothetical protein
MITEVGSPENPTLFRELSLYDFKISVLCTMSELGLLGPVFLEP